MALPVSLRRSGQGRSGQGRSGQGRSGQGRSGQGRSGQAKRSVTRLEAPLLAIVDFAALRRRARRRRLIMIGFFAVIVSLFAVALVQAMLVEKQHELDLLRVDVRTLQAEHAKLERRVGLASSPSEIVARAEEIGMVRAEGTVYLPAVRGVGGS